MQAALQDRSGESGATRDSEYVAWSGVQDDWRNSQRVRGVRCTIKLGLANAESGARSNRQACTIHALLLDRPIS